MSGVNLQFLRKNRRLLRLFWALLALTWAACSAPKAAWDPQADPATTGQWARDHLDDPDLTAEAHRQTAWLCLLWSEGCPEAARMWVAKSTGKAPATPEHPRWEDTGEAALAGAWLADGYLHGAAAAERWISAAEALQPIGNDGDRAATQALLRAAYHGESAARPIGSAARIAPSMLGRGAPAQRVLRAIALARLGIGAGRLPDDLTVAQQVQPWSRRLMSGLDAFKTGDPSAPPPAWRAETAVALPVDVSAGGTARFALVVEHPGIVRVQLRWRGDGALLLGARGERTILAWLDGVRLNLAEPGLAAEAKILSGDKHQLDLLVPASGDGDPLWVTWLADSAAAPRQPAGPQTPQEAEPSQELEWLMAHATGLLAEPTSRVAEWWTRQFPKALLPSLRGLFAGATQQGGAAVDQVRAAWPQHGQAILMDAERHLEAGNPQAAMEQLDLLRQTATGPAVARPSGDVTRQASLDLPSLAARLVKARALQQLGLGDLSRAALANELPRSCVERKALWEAALEFGHRPLLRLWAPTADASDCPELWLTAAQVLQGAGEAGRARQALQQAADRPALARQAWQRQLQDAALTGQVAPPAPTWLQDTAQVQWQLAQQAWLQRDSRGAEHALGAALAARGPTLAQRQQALRSGARPPWTPWLRDGSKIASLPDDPQLMSGARLAWLLDQEVVVLLPGGGAIRRVHQILRVLADDAAEAVGEVRVAQGADLELARTLLADGTALPPADTADKETVSLRGVQAGTAVEYAQVVYVSPEDPATGATRLDPFLLQAYDGPVRESELVVLVPDGVTVTLERSPSAPAAEIKRLGTFTVYTFRATNVPRARAEPRAARPELAVASVRLSAQADLPSVLEPWQEALAAMVLKPSESLLTWQQQAAEIPDSKERWQNLARRIGRHVKQHHEGGMPGAAAAALDHRQGDRAALFYTLARRLGADACLVRVRPLAREPAGLAADPTDWPMELVLLRKAGSDLWYDPGLEGGLLDHVRTGLRGRPGLLVGCTPPAGNPRVSVPSLGEGQDLREISAQLQWRVDGAVTGQVQDTLHGAVAALVRQFLASTPAAELESLLADLAGSAFPGLKLSWLESSGREAATGPLVLRYSVSGPPSAQRQSSLDLGLYPAELGKTYAGLPQRQTPLLLGHSADLRVQLRVLSPGKPIVPVGSLKAHHPLVQLERTASSLPDGILLSYRLAVSPGVVAPSDYPAAAEALRAVDTAEQVRLTR